MMHPSATLDQVLASASETMFLNSTDETPLTIHTRGYDNDSALHVMAWRKDFYGASILVEAGADVNALGEMGETPLHVAVRHGPIELVELLMRAGADAEIESDFGRTAREIADLDQPAIAQLIRKIEDELD